MKKVFIQAGKYVIDPYMISYMWIEKYSEVSCIFIVMYSSSGSVIKICSDEPNYDFFKVMIDALENDSISVTIFDFNKYIELDS